MYRDFAFDLFDTSVVVQRACPRSTQPAPARAIPTTDPGARLRSLKALMDAERDHRLGPCLLMARAADGLKAASRRRTKA